MTKCTIGLSITGPSAIKLVRDVDSQACYNVYNHLQVTDEKKLYIQSLKILAVGLVKEPKRHALSGYTLKSIKLQAEQSVSPLVLGM